MMDVFDTHAHLNDRQFAQDLDQVLERASKRGVTYIVNVGYDLDASRVSVELAQRYAKVYAAVGIHPHDAADVKEETYDSLRFLATKPKVVAIGELGLDYYRDLSPRDKQKEVFRRQIALARELKLPVIIHDRDAHGDMLGILRQEKAGDVGGVMHCFSGSWEMAKQCLDMGFYISLAGPVTFKNAKRPQEVARRVPIDRLLVETDCPYLAPEPYRGKRNEPAFVTEVVERIAELRNMSAVELAYRTTENAKKVFGI